MFNPYICGNVCVVGEPNCWEFKENSAVASRFVNRFYTTV